LEIGFKAYKEYIIEHPKKSTTLLQTQS